MHTFRPAGADATRGVGNETASGAANVAECQRVSPRDAPAQVVAVSGTVSSRSPPAAAWSSVPVCDTVRRVILIAELLGSSKRYSVPFAATLKARCQGLAGTTGRTETLPTSWTLTFPFASRFCSRRGAGLGGGGG